MRLVARAVRLRVHHDLRTIIYHGQTVVALDNPTRARHLGALRVGHVALLLVARRTQLLLGVPQERRDLFDFAPVALDLLRVPGARPPVLFLLIALAMPLHDPLGHALELLA